MGYRAVVSPELDCHIPHGLHLGSNARRKSLRTKGVDRVSDLKWTKVAHSRVHACTRMEMYCCTHDGV